VWAAIAAGVIAAAACGTVLGQPALRSEQALRSGR
jgi:ABC-type branched-subunit amino acid transport system permease subunit